MLILSNHVEICARAFSENIVRLNNTMPSDLTAIRDATNIEFGLINIG